jgi:hypothetical protein
MLAAVLQPTNRCCRWGLACARPLLLLLLRLAGSQQGVHCPAGLCVAHSRQRCGGLAHVQCLGAWAQAPEDHHQGICALPGQHQTLHASALLLLLLLLLLGLHWGCCHLLHLLLLLVLLLVLLPLLLWGLLCWLVSGRVSCTWGSSCWWGRVLRLLDCGCCCCCCWACLTGRPESQARQCHQGVADVTPSYALSHSRC